MEDFMKRTYTGFLRTAYNAPKKRINALGRNIDFINGVARGIPEDQALFLLNKNIIASMEIETSVDTAPAPIVPVVEEAPVVVEQVVVEEEEEDVVEEEPVVEEDPAAEEEPVFEEDPSETDEVLDISSLTEEDIRRLYDEHGTWSAVAASLGITTVTLKKYRESLGI